MTTETQTLDPRKALTQKCRQVMMKVWDLKNQGEYISPQSVAEEMRLDVHARIATELQTLERIGYLRVIRHSHVNTQIVPLKLSFDF